MDYVSEQEMEIEALEAILMDEFEIYEGTAPDGWTTHTVYRVKLKPSEEDEEKLDRRSKTTPIPHSLSIFLVALDFLFSHTETYPDEAPRIRLQSSAGLADEDISQVQLLVENEIEGNKGMAMMFNLIEAAREWLRDKVNASGFCGMSPEEHKKALEAEEEQKILEQRSHGTPVTVESFMEWNIKFQEEMQALAAKQGRGKQEEKSQQLTGKQFFLAHEGEEEVEDTEDGDEDDEIEDFEINYSDDGESFALYSFNLSI
eukprot:g1987.t1